MGDNRGFISHRCKQKPDDVSIRRYTVPDEDRGNSMLDPYAFFRLDGNWPGSGWVLAKHEIDFDFDYEYLKDFGTVSFCPFCGERLP